MTLSTQTPNLDLPDLSLDLDTLAGIIVKAREFDVKVGSSDIDAPRVDDDDVDASVLEDRPSDPVRKELISLISDLDIDEQLDLVALVWLGREDGAPEDWEDLRRTAAEEHTNRTAAYLLGMPLLSDHLEAGADILGLDLSEYSETDL